MLVYERAEFESNFEIGSEPQGGHIDRITVSHRGIRHARTSSFGQPYQG